MALLAHESWQPCLNVIFVRRPCAPKKTAAKVSFQKHAVSVKKHIAPMTTAEKGAMPAVVLFAANVGLSARPTIINIIVMTALAGASNAQVTAAPSAYVEINIVVIAFVLIA